MATLTELQRRFHAVLRGEVPVADGAAVLGVDPRRLGIYADFVRGHVAGVLAKDFPITRALLGPDRWSALTAAYFAERPCQHWELNHNAADLPAFLATWGAEDPAVDPFHVAVAVFEWERFAAYVRPVEMPTPAARSGPTLNPTVSVVELPCPTVAWIVARDEGRLDPAAPLPAASDGPERVLFFRDPADDGVCYHVAVDDLLFALKVAHDGLSPSAVAEAHGLPLEAADAAWRRAVDIGLVLAPT